MIYDLPDRVPQGGFEPLEVESIDCNKNRESLNILPLLSPDRWAPLLRYWICLFKCRTEDAFGRTRWRLDSR